MGIDLHLPEGYKIDRGQVFGGKEYVLLYKKGVLILSLQKEHCPDETIEKVIKQTQ